MHECSFTSSAILIIMYTKSQLISMGYPPLEYTPISIPAEKDIYDLVHSSFGSVLDCVKDADGRFNPLTIPVTSHSPQEVVDFVQAFTCRPTAPVTPDADNISEDVFGKIVPRSVRDASSAAQYVNSSSDILREVISKNANKDK